MGGCPATSKCSDWCQSDCGDCAVCHVMFEEGHPCKEDCDDGWCMENCEGPCKECNMEGSPESCSEECQARCTDCAVCHWLVESWLEGEHPCDDMCHEGWCEKECKAPCEGCAGKDGCPEGSKCTPECQEKCADCAKCHMFINWV